MIGDVQAEARFEIIRSAGTCCDLGRAMPPTMSCARGRYGCHVASAARAPLPRANLLCLIPACLSRCLPGPPMVLVSGCHYRDEHPQLRVRLTRPSYLGKYELTQT